MRQARPGWGWIALWLGLAIVGSAVGSVASGANAPVNEAEAVEEAADPLAGATQMTAEEAAAALVPEFYEYRNGWRRDPFATLVADRNELPSDERVPGIDDLVIVGILWGPREALALIETPWGRSLVLRAGDSVRDGHVVAIAPDGVTMEQQEFGLSRRVVLPIVSGEEVNDER